MTVPNPPQDGMDASPTTRPLPTPENWRGVGQGLKDATDLLRLNLFAQAEDGLLQLLEFAPMEGKAWHLLGRCHQLQKRHGKALECFERAGCCYSTRHSDKNESPASMRIARMLWEQGETSSARAMLAQLLAEQAGDSALLDDLIKQQQEWNETQANAATAPMREALA
ncbi:MAG: tetratricopeptide repeat protein [Mariprofundaceae bacterium]|nr:tetratricopeptide repeat protein [Mariprofundaceae bacterium]